MMLHDYSCYRNKLFLLQKCILFQFRTVSIFEFFSTVKAGREKKKKKKKKEKKNPPTLSCPPSHWWDVLVWSSKSQFSKFYAKPVSKRVHNRPKPRQSWNFHLICFSFFNGHILVNRCSSKCWGKGVRDCTWAIHVSIVTDLIRQQL